MMLFWLIPYQLKDAFIFIPVADFSTYNTRCQVEMRERILDNKLTLLSIPSVTLVV